MEQLHHNSFFGNNVNSTVLGVNPDIPSNANYSDNLAMQFDFRQLYASIFEQWLCVDPADSSNFLLNNFGSVQVTDRDLCAIKNTHEVNQLAGKSVINISPNPVSTFSTIDFVSNGSPLVIRLFDMNGRQISEILRGFYPQGKHSLSWNASDLPSGNYFLRITGPHFDQSKKLIKI